MACLPGSTTSALAFIYTGRGGRTRTRDRRFWRPLLYQTELHPCIAVSSTPGASRTHDTRFRKPLLYPLSYRGPNGDRGIRTPDLCDANAALSQLSYIPRTETGRHSNTSFGKLDSNGSVITMSRNPGSATPPARENRRTRHRPPRYSSWRWAGIMSRQYRRQGAT